MPRGWEQLRRPTTRDPIARQIVDIARGLGGRRPELLDPRGRRGDRPTVRSPTSFRCSWADAGLGENGERQFRTVHQFSMKPIEEIGLLKMDFLGLAQPRCDRGTRSTSIERSKRDPPGHGHAAAR